MARIRLRHPNRGREERQWENWQRNRVGKEQKGMKKVNNVCTTSEFKLFKTSGPERELIQKMNVQ